MHIQVMIRIKNQSPNKNPKNSAQVISTPLAWASPQNTPHALPPAQQLCLCPLQLSYSGLLNNPPVHLLLVAQDPSPARPHTPAVAPDAFRVSRHAHEHHILSHGAAGRASVGTLVYCGSVHAGLQRADGACGFHAAVDPCADRECAVGRNVKVGCDRQRPAEGV